MRAIFSIGKRESCALSDPPASLFRGIPRVSCVEGIKMERNLSRHLFIKRTRASLAHRRGTEQRSANCVAAKLPFKPHLLSTGAASWRPRMPARTRRRRRSMCALDMNNCRGRPKSAEETNRRGRRAAASTHSMPFFLSGPPPH